MKIRFFIQGGLIFVISLFLTSFFNKTFTYKISSENISALQILHQMIDSIENIQTLKIKLIALERIQDKYLKAISITKISYSKPKKLYFINPEKKIEILYIEDENDNKALVKHPSLPFSIYLDPNGSVMKKNQHYTIHELGFQYIARTIQVALSKEKEKYLNYLHFLGIHEKNGKPCYTLMYESSNFDFFTYTVVARETVVSIARKFNINEYIIRDKNNLYNHFGFLKKGTTLLLPKMYCKKAFIYIDKSTMLPVSINLYDDKGLLESYDYENVQKNIPIKDEEFSKNYKEYNF
ncbi:MAG: hypothetical protein KatS3mg027_0917 [Bacteroidia bacterium]|nr:MAG: hypothetical protein KatS3mg027_0917 [Bacteroidia bacterium]